MGGKKILKNKENMKSVWYRLDNAAKLYPAIESERITTLFRISFTLFEAVNPVLLNKALTNIMHRFPYYRVRLRRGFFWYYIEHNPKEPYAKEDMHYPCTKLNPKTNRQYLFKVLYYNKIITVEFSHVLTDGTGGMIFLKTLVAEYLRLKNITVSYGEGVLDLDQHADDEEPEDAFNRFYKPSLPYPRIDSAAYHMRGTMEKASVYNIITGVVPLNEILSKAKSLNVTLTEFLAAVYLDSLQQMQQLQKGPRHLRPVRLSVPINLRKLYPSRTMRNFSLYTVPGIDPRLGHYTFDEILKAVHYHMRSEINEKSISRQISRNVYGERNFAVKIIPLFVKNFFAPYLYKYAGENLYSGSLSNLGEIKLPKEMESHIERVDFIPGPGPINKSSCSAASFGDYLYISFGRIIKEATLERLFFTSLVKMGIHVRIESNH